MQFRERQSSYNLRGIVSIYLRCIYVKTKEGTSSKSLSNTVEDKSHCFSNDYRDGVNISIHGMQWIPKKEPWLETVFETLETLHVICPPKTESNKTSLCTIELYVWCLAETCQCTLDGLLLCILPVQMKAKKFLRHCAFSKSPNALERLKL